MKVSRRELLMGGAGAAAGFLFTPVPWKVLSGVSMWSQNWPWIPQASRLPVETKHSVCTLCPAGCGVRVRLAGNAPVGIAGVKSDPVTHGALCPLAFAAHQLNWHPQRLREVRHNGKTASWAEAQAAFERACAEGKLSIVDGRPGRAASSILQVFARARQGAYQAVLSPESQALAPYTSWSGVPVEALGYDLEDAATIVSFGAPLLDGWGTPGRFTRLWGKRGAAAPDSSLQLIQVDSSLSRTAALASRWVAIREESEGAMAAGLARVLLEENLVKPGPLPATSLSEAASRTGLTVDAIRDLARTLAQKPPVLVISADGNRAVAALNLLLGGIARHSNILGGTERKERRAPVVDAGGAARAVLIDASVPWDFVPARGAEVFRFAAWDGGGSTADWLLPAPGFLEELTDVPTAPASAVETYAIADQLTAAPDYAQGATQFLTHIDSTQPSLAKIIRTRCQALVDARQGTVCREQVTPVTQIKSAEDLYEELRKGAIWVGETPDPRGLRCVLKEWPEADEVANRETAAGADWTASWNPPVLPPLATKLYQESDLRERPNPARKERAQGVQGQRRNG